jgi:predicted molibdopterin-dependent oxidoreductase YjgC
LATITVDGREVEAPEGANLLETLKNAGTYMSNLCYIDGLAPYAGCRTCLVDIEGARGLQLSCTSKVVDKMVVRTEIPEVAEARKQVVSIILANHSDRCLTCHRREHCHPGDICLRDSVVTHRCLTCPKNYRCELQVTCEVVGMSLYEPWEGEARSFYAAEEYPPADQGNPFLEFDPKMCIICTRCVRACDELRHTSAITLAGRGYGTRIAFGAGGAIDESSCDFCGACIDVCPTATLLEHPHKWTSKPEAWVPTVCSYCSVGCTINLGVKDGRGVMVRPHKANPVSNDQICVRGRFHYDALRQRDYLSRPLVRRGDVMAPAGWDEAITAAADSLARTVRDHGPDAVGFLGGAMSSNEELYLLQRIARGVTGTNNIDSTAGPIASRVASAIRGAFGTEVLPADLTNLAKSTHILVVGDDLEASHPVAALRIKDAVTRNKAQLITVCERRGELVDFSESWLCPRPGESAAALAALAQSLLEDEAVRSNLAAAGVGGVDRVAGSGAPASNLDGFSRATEVLAGAVANGEDGRIAVVFAPVWGNTWASAELARAAANLAIIAAGPTRAPESFFYLPTDVNVIGMRDTGGIPDLLPGYHRLDDQPFREELARVWGSEPPREPGLDLRGMLQAARSGSLKALVVLGDDPMLRCSGTSQVREALERLDLLVVIDCILTETAKAATIVLPDVDVYGKDGTYTPADRRVLRRTQATEPAGEAHPAWETLVALGENLASRLSGAAAFPFAGPSDVMDEIARLLPLYADANYTSLVLGDRSNILNGSVPETPSLLESAAQEGGNKTPTGGADLMLLTGRSLYTSYEAASLHKPDADKQFREDKIEISALDADRLGLQLGDRIRLVSLQGALEGAVKPTDGVAEGTVYVSALFGGGAINALLPDDGSEAQTSVRIERLN